MSMVQASALSASSNVACALLLHYLVTNAHTEAINGVHIFLRESCCYLFTANGLSQALFSLTACICGSRCCQFL